MNGIIAAGIVLFVLGGAGFFGYVQVKKKLAEVSRTLFGTDSFLEGYRRQADILATTPKSVSGMTRVFKPQIERDFPELNLIEFKNKAENMLVAALQAIDAKDSTGLQDATKELRMQVENQIEKNRLEGVEEFFKEIRIHRTEITNYVKKNGTCSIVFQSAVGHKHYKKRNDTVIEGDEKRLTQTKYNMELVYIQDEKQLKSENAIGTTCPNCGAPITNLGAKYCEYCGVGITLVNHMVWNIQKFYEV